MTIIEAEGTGSGQKLPCQSYEVLGINIRDSMLLIIAVLRPCVELMCCMQARYSASYLPNLEWVARAVSFIYWLPERVSLVISYQVRFSFSFSLMIAPNIVTWGLAACYVLHNRVSELAAACGFLGTKRLV
jgi:hypothetical protein